MDVKVKRIFIWERVGELTDNYHDSGGVAIIAADLAAARRLLPRSECEAHTKPPTFESEIASDEDRIFEFPDAGCC